MTMMNENFAIEWENIEYALNESELIALNEVQTRPVYKMGFMGKAAAAPAAAVYKTGKNVAGMAVDSVRNWDPTQIGKKSVLGITKTAGRIARGPLCQTPFWQRLLAKIREIWQKFKNVMSALFRTNQSFVNNELYNAEAIINNALAQDSVDGEQNNLNITFKDIRPYWNGERYFNQIKIPPFDPNNQQMMDSLSDVNQFVATELRGLSNLDFNNGDCINQLTHYLSGGDPINCSLYDLVPYIKNIISYCIDYKAILADLQRTQESLERAAQESISVIQRSGIMQETTNSGQFDSNIENNKINNVADTTMRINNYIRCVSRISGVQKTVVRDRYNQSINILREVLKKCRPASKSQIQNAEVNNKTEVTKPSSNEENDKEYKDNMWGRFQAKRDTNKKLAGNPASKGEIEITDNSLMNSLPNNEKKLKKRAERVNQEKQEIANFIKNKKISQNDPRFQALYDQYLSYEKHLAVINKKLNDLGKGE